jgi:hypothetical protein
MARSTKRKRKTKRKGGGNSAGRVLIQPPRIAGHDGQLAAWRNARGRALRSGAKTYPNRKD